MTYLSYPEALHPFIYTTNALERFIKEIKRRAKVIEASPHPLSAEKIVFLVTVEMNERYRNRSLRGFQEIKEELLSIRRMRYGEEGKSRAKGGDTKILTRPSLKRPSKFSNYFLISCKINTL